MYDKIFKFLILLFLLFNIFSPNNIMSMNDKNILSDNSSLYIDNISREEQIIILKNLINKLIKKIEKIISNNFKYEKNILNNNAFDFYSENINLKVRVEDELKKMSVEQKAGMVFMVSYDKNSTLKEIEHQIKDLKIGGILTLVKNPDKNLLNKLENYNNNELPLLFSADAESSLLKYRFPNFEKNNKDIGETSDIKSEKKSKEIAGRISKMLYSEGYDVNFAPIYDVNKNKTIISNRSFSSENNVVQKLANSFMIETQEGKIFATAKHFPGHGNVTEDSHKKLAVISGELKEIDNFKSAIDNKVVFMMVGHIAISNNEK